MGESIITGIIGTAIIKLLNWIAYAVAYVGGQFLILESKFLAWVIDKSIFTKMPIVVIGWKISRDLANLFFIAILVYIAFATILRIRGYQDTKMLGKVLIMAILINFSLTISGIIIDFSQLMMRYFLFSYLPGDKKDGTSFATMFATALKFQQFWSPTEHIGSTENIEREEEKENLFVTLIKIVFIIVFVFICVITLGAIFLVLFVRNFWIWFLLILAPLGWLLSAIPIPVLSNYAKEWWNKFLSYVFVGPIIAFFIYLAFAIVIDTKTSGEIQETLLSVNLGELGSQGEISDTKNPNSVFNLQQILQLSLIIGFLIASLISSKSISSKVAGGALGLIKQAGNKVKNKAANWGLRGANALRLPQIGSAIQTGMGRLAEKGILGKLTAGTLGMLGVNALGRALELPKKKLGEDIKERQKKFEHLSNDQLYARLPGLFAADRAAVLRILAERKALKDDHREEVLGLFQKFGLGADLSKIMKNFPHWSDKAQHLASQVAFAKNEQERENAMADLVNHLGPSIAGKNIKELNLPQAKPGDKKQEALMEAYRRAILNNFSPREILKLAKAQPDMREFLRDILGDAEGKNLDDFRKNLKDKDWEATWSKIPALSLIFDGKNFDEVTKEIFREKINKINKRINERIEVLQEMLKKNIKKKLRNFRKTK